ncbi:hypothetical protein EPO34_00120 [Patescibacteria group bacterium]|nr:MAG: hypothetical protein EPO34_00120 [Patescibacteria group bacterium]
MNAQNQQIATKAETKPGRVRVDVLVKINVTKDEIARLLAASSDKQTGLYCDEKGRRDLILLNDRHAEEAKAVGLEPTRYEQDLIEGGRDGKGAVKRADSGVKVFGQDGLSLARIDAYVADLKAAGAKLVEAHIQRKKINNPQQRGVLILGYISGNAIPGKELTAELLGAVDAMMKRTYGAIHVWKNPPGSAHTVNCTDVVGRDSRDDRRAKNALRFIGGEFTNERA